MDNFEGRVGISLDSIGVFTYLLRSPCLDILHMANYYEDLPRSIYTPSHGAPQYALSLQLQLNFYSPISDVSHYPPDFRRPCATLNASQSKASITVLIQPISLR